MLIILCIVLRRKRFCSFAQRLIPLILNSIKVCGLLLDKRNCLTVDDRLVGENDDFWREKYPVWKMNCWQRVPYPPILCRPLLFPIPLAPSFLNFVQPPISCASILQPIALSAALFNLLILRIYTCQAFAA